MVGCPVQAALDPQKGSALHFGDGVLLSEVLTVFPGGTDAC